MILPAPVFREIKIVEIFRHAFTGAQDGSGIVVASLCDYPDNSYIGCRGRYREFWWYLESVCFIHMCKPRQLDMLGVR